MVEGPRTKVGGTRDESERDGEGERDVEGKRDVEGERDGKRDREGGTVRVGGRARARARARGCGLRTGHERGWQGDFEKKDSNTKNQPWECLQGHATVTPLCSTFSFFQSHLVSVHRYPSLTSNVSRRGLFSPTPMHGQSRYVN